MPIVSATIEDADVVTALIAELLAEVEATMDQRLFNVEPRAMAARLGEALRDGRYLCLLARDPANAAVGVLTLTECFSLYAGGSFGIIPELYVQPPFRGRGLGRALMARAGRIAVERGWSQLEVTTPPLPGFDRTLAFYRREGFTMRGGRKLGLRL